ncbi:clathrin light chain protein [Hordeum vulgare]|nr:clathrin light chain protein [Hordeum vulgare]
MATAFDSPTSSPAAAPFHDDSFLSFADGGAPAADIHVSGSGGDDFPASLDPYAFRHDSAAAHAFGMPDSNGNGTMTTSSPTPTSSSPTLPRWGPTTATSSTSGAGPCAPSPCSSRLDMIDLARLSLL